MKKRLWKYFFFSKISVAKWENMSYRHFRLCFITCSKNTVIIHLTPLSKHIVSKEAWDVVCLKKNNVTGAVN